jgi:hypothetical protein
VLGIEDDSLGTGYGGMSESWNDGCSGFDLTPGLHIRDSNFLPTILQEAAVNEIKYTQQGGGLFRENKFKSHKIKYEYHNT